MAVVIAATIMVGALRLKLSACNTTTGLYPYSESKLFTFSEYNACNDAILKMIRTIDQAIRITEEKDFYDKNIETLSKSFERMNKELSETMKEIAKTVIEISRNISESFRGFFNGLGE